MAGFYLQHRETSDLDLFTPDGEAFDRGRHVLEAAAAALGATLARRQHAPGFERYVVSRGKEAVLVDLVWDRTPQLGQKAVQGQIRFDSLQEILVNKLTTVLSRAEERDLVDLMLIEKAGHPVKSALESALAKDGGCTPAALAWVLSQVEIPEGATLPAGVSSHELQLYLEDLIRRLRRAAAPGARPGGATR